MTEIGHRHEPIDVEQDKGRTVDNSAMYEALRKIEGVSDEEAHAAAEVVFKLS